MKMLDILLLCLLSAFALLLFSKKDHAIESLDLPKSLELPAPEVDSVDKGDILNLEALAFINGSPTDIEEEEFFKRQITVSDTERENQNANY